MNRTAVQKYAPAARRDFIQAVTARAHALGITEKDSLPAQMDLEITDALSPAARAVVDRVVANPEAIAQAVNFSHDGALPGTATVMIRKTGGVNADELKLYYINETTGTVEQAEIVSVSETTLDGVDYYVVTVAHCSEYLIAGAITLKEEGGGSTEVRIPFGRSALADYLCVHDEASPCLYAAMSRSM